MTVPDFRRANFNLCTENPFRLTPPAAQANPNVTSNGDNANAASAASEHSTQHKSTQQNYPDPSFSDIFSAFSEAFTQRKAQGLAFLELTNSELMLIKKSFFVTVFACLASFAVGTVCWLILNIAIVAFLYSVRGTSVAVPLLFSALYSFATFYILKLVKDGLMQKHFTRMFPM